MPTTIRFFGAAAFEIVTSGGFRVIVDPFMDENPVSPVRSADLERVDLVLVTHGAYDHLGDADKIARRDGAPIVCGPEVKEALLSRGMLAEQVLALAWGMVVDFRGLRVRPVESRHTSRVRLADGRWATGFPMGFIVYADEQTRIYHMGDTALFGDLRLIGELYRPNVTLVHVALPDVIKAGDARVVTGELTPYEAALACQWLQTDYAVTCHYLDATCGEVQEFKRLIQGMTADGRPAIQMIALQPGESWGPPSPLPPLPVGEGPGVRGED
ncbi:MAG: MBL fold metallo-hydrolase [Chloroflexi bacterium]|nr:MBL fold metallo-hydrolase [Chloroflexota bacterium]